MFRFVLAVVLSLASVANAIDENALATRSNQKHMSHDGKMAVSVTTEGDSQMLEDPIEKKNYPSAAMESHSVQIKYLSKAYCQACQDYGGQTWPESMDKCSYSQLKHEPSSNSFIVLPDTNPNAGTCYRPTQSNIPPYVSSNIKFSRRRRSQNFPSSEQKVWAASVDGAKVCKCMNRWIDECAQEYLDNDRQSVCLYQKMCKCSACKDVKDVWGCNKEDLAEVEAHNASGDVESLIKRSHASSHATSNVRADGTSQGSGKSSITLARRVKEIEADWAAAAAQSLDDTATEKCT